MSMDPHHAAFVPACHSVADTEEEPIIARVSRGREQSVPVCDETI